jgi:hypothetical protein
MLQIILGMIESNEHNRNKNAGNFVRSFTGGPRSQESREITDF